MRGIRLEQANPDGSRFTAYLKPGGRDIVAATGRYGPNHTGEIPAPPPYEATGLACYDAYSIHDGEMAPVLWMLVDRLRRRRMRAAYRRKAGRR